MSSGKGKGMWGGGGRAASSGIETLHVAVDYCQVFGAVLSVVSDPHVNVNKIQLHSQLKHITLATFTYLDWCLVFTLLFFTFFFFFFFSFFDARLAFVAIFTGWDAVLDGADVAFDCDEGGRRKKKRKE